MKILTVEEKNIVAGVLLDTRKYNELMDSPNHPNVWALDYVYDSRLQDDFEIQLKPQEISDMKSLCCELLKTNNLHMANWMQSIL